MNTRYIFTKLSIAIALLALLGTGAVWEVRRVKAVAPPDPERTVGMVGITQGQTVRLNIVNLLPPGPCRVSPPPDPDLPPGPCRVLLTFRDANGQPFSDSNGQVIRQVVELQGGQSAFLDLNGDLFAGGISTNGGPARLQLRPVVRVLDAPFPTPWRASLEVFDNASGRTSVFASFEPPPDPDRGGGQ
jgi:hypothetical protein